MNARPLKVASVGIGWWSDVLADAARRTDGRVEIVSCFTRSADKRRAFADKYGCAAVASFEEILAKIAYFASSHRIFLTSGKHISKRAFS